MNLSICIPTYNRAVFLEETLESVLSQTTEGVEIVISDNGSQDHTEKIVRRLQQKWPRITYFRWDENKGADRNYLKVVELANGEYCWLLGSDDALIPGAIRSILCELEHGDDIYLCNRTDCTGSLQPVRKYRWLKATGNRLFDFSQQDDLLDYFHRANSIGAVFSYLSSIIVKRSAWNAVAYDPSMTGTAYAHAYILVSLMTKGAKLRYLQEAMVLCRFGNDSFLHAGVFNRFMIDIVGYLKIANLFDNKEVRSAFLSIMTREQPWNRLAKIKHFYPDKWQRVRPFLEEFGYSQSTLTCVEILGSIPYLVGWMIQLKHKLTRLH